MFTKGDLIVYGNHGVCTVKKVGHLDTPGSNQEKIYYTLNPYYMKDSTIFTPVDNPRVEMRSILTKEEVEHLIDDIPTIDTLWINDDKRRELDYKESLKKNDVRDFIRIIKTTYIRQEERLAEGKKRTALDEKYFKLAEEQLYGELGIVLGMSIDDVKDYIKDKVAASQE